MHSNSTISFDYGFFKKIISYLKMNFSIYTFTGVLDILQEKTTKPIVLLRHDIDLDLNYAHKMAMIEVEENVQSCYMIMTNSPFYSINDPDSKSIIHKLISNGHEIGLHYDFDDYLLRNKHITIDNMNENILSAFSKLEDVIGTEVKSISFHRPMQQFLNGPLTILGRTNAYSAELMKWYLSDSKGNWREGNPLIAMQTIKNNILQLLIHPIWWNDFSMNAGERLQYFFEEKTKFLSIDERTLFDNTLASYLSIKRSERK